MYLIIQCDVFNYLFIVFKLLYFDFLRLNFNRKLRRGDPGTCDFYGNKGNAPKAKGNS